MAIKFNDAPTSDLQSRLRTIENRCDQICCKYKNEPVSDLADLAYLVSYLAAVVETHLRTGEQ